jgi:CheY-like chemotaxis protein
MSSQKIVVDVGQCDPDHASIRRAVEQFGVQVHRAHSGADAKKLVASGDVALVLVNRVLDADGSDGMAIIEELLSIGAAPVMLVSNYPEYQAKAVAMGALPGFGKAALREPGTLAMLQGVLQSNK